MTTTLAVEDIKVSLPELLDSLTPGDERILSAGSSANRPRRGSRESPKSRKGMMTLLIEDDEHLDGFAEYQ